MTPFRNALWINGLAAQVELPSKFASAHLLSSVVKDSHLLSVLLSHWDKRERAEVQPAEVIERIQDEAERQKAAIAEATQHVHFWLDGKDANGEELPPMQRSPLEKFATVATLEEIEKENDFNLNISRYVDSTEPVRSKTPTTCKSRLILDLCSLASHGFRPNSTDVCHLAADTKRTTRPVGQDRLPMIVENG